MQLTERIKKGGFLLFLIVLGGTLAALCHDAFLHHYISWANDVPLGAMMDKSAQLPGAMAGHWSILEWIGGPTPSSSPALSTLLQMIFPPQIYLKIFVPLCMFFFGFGAWLFFRELGFSRATCVIGGLGAGLNMHYFSNACWGLGTWAISGGMVFISLAILVSPRIKPLWVKGALCGLSIGMIVMEGFDTGAILTLYVGVFIIFYFLTVASAPSKGILKAIGMGTVIVFFAILISASTLFTLVGTQIKGTNPAKTEQQKREHWEFVTMYSFPKLESLRIAIPGLMGFRLQDYITDTNKDSAYWGRISEDPRAEALDSDDPKVRSDMAAAMGLPQEYQNILAGNDVALREQVVDQLKSQMARRHTGSGDYVGILVLVLAAFGLCNAWRKAGGPFSLAEREVIWFWGAAALLAITAAWGRYAPVYQFIYHLPFINNIRSPIKFLHPLNIFLIILSGYGLEALYRSHLRTAVNKSAFDGKWIIGSSIFLGLSVLGFLIYSSHKNDIVHYLTHNGFGPEQSSQIADFSIKEVLFYCLFLAASVGVIIAVLKGVWAGPSAKVAWCILGAIMIFDLGRADSWWVRYYDYDKVYSMNPVVDFLRHDPWEHRVMSRILPTSNYLPSNDGRLLALCHWWLENDYLANQIQSLEVDQWPREPDLDKNFISAFAPHGQQDLASPVRLWRLTNTRYILADARLTPALNELAQPKYSFKNIMLMDIVTKPGVTEIHDAGDLTVQTNDSGNVALIEFTKALPRAALYANWQTLGDSETLAKLSSAEFDPTSMVLIATNTPLAEKPLKPDADPGSVKITDYESKDVKLSADARTSTVLLLNDRTGDFWNVSVDGKPAQLLRCNYIMRGVFVPEGHHTIEFRFEAPLQWLYVSVAAFAFGILLGGYVLVSRLRKSSDQPA